MLNESFDLMQTVIFLWKPYEYSSRLFNRDNISEISTSLFLYIL